MKKLYIAHRKKVFACLLILAAAALGFAGGRQSMERKFRPSLLPAPSWSCAKMPE